MRRIWHFAAAALCALIAGPARAETNLIGNPGFESGDFTGWALSGEARPDHSFVSSPTHYPGWDEFLPHGGNAFAALGGVGSDVVLSQTFATTPGETYTLSFRLGSDGETPNQIRVYFSEDGFDTGLLTLVNQAETPGHDLIHGPAAAAYTAYSFTVHAVFPVSMIAFAARNDEGWWAVDDVSVTLPEPSSLASLGAGILALCACARCRRRSSS
jgi:hypothetical protein